VPPERLVTIYKGHAAEWYEGQPAVHLGQFGVPPGVPVVACTANMRPVKGVDVLIEAFQFVAAQTEAHLLLIGEVRDVRLERLVERGGLRQRVHFTGYRIDAPAIVRSCDVFVMPSRAREGLPKAVLEAMAQGVPPVVSAVGGLPEVVRDQVSGLVVPPAAPRPLAEAVIRVVNDTQLRTMLSRGARATVAGDFSIERTVEGMRRVLFAVSGRPMT
jgi:glycosyltransferase involved in cell wall biosynthesis